MKVIFLAVLASAAVGAAPDNAVVFRADFDAAARLQDWTGSGGELVEGYQATRSLVIEQAVGPEPGSVMRYHEVPVNEIAGRLITLEARVKAEGVGERPQSWNGIKVMLVLEFPDGKQHPQLPVEVGTFDWRHVSRSLRVPRGIVKASLAIGLERVAGRAWFDDIVIRIARPAWAGGRRRETMFKGHNLPRLRGAMHGPKFKEEDFRALALEWGANHMRWQLNWVPMKQAEEWAKDLDAYDRWLDGALEDCDRAVDLAEELGVLLLVDLHCPPGGRVEGGVCRLFGEKRYQDKLLEVWARIAGRYKGRKAVWAYDLLNEPVEGTVAAGLLNWRELATKAVETIRAVEPGKPVVLEPGPWGSPAGFDSFRPLDLDGVIYSCHMYQPHSFTHQGVRDSPVGLVYPGLIGGERWNKDRLREALQPARDFQQAFNVAMYIGEFSAIRWAPENSAYRYLKDLVEIFEEYGWDWAYHAFREWNGWSVEHTTDPQNRQPSPTPTDRERLLRSWYAKNERPRSARAGPETRANTRHTAAGKRD